MFCNEKVQRAIGALVLVTFTSLTLYPLTAAAQVKTALEKAGMLPSQPDEGAIGNAKRYFSKLAGEAPTRTTRPGDRFSQLLAAIHDDLKAVVPQTALSKEARRFRTEAGAPAASDKRGGMETRALGPNLRIETERAAAIQPLPGTDVAAKVRDVRTKTAELRTLYPAVEQGFQETERHLKAANLPPTILERQAAAVAQYQARKEQFERLMGKVEVAPDGSADQQAALVDLGRFMAQYPNAKPHEYTDPNKLPFRTPNGKVREPFTSKTQYQASLFPPKYEKVMLASLTLDGVQLAQATLPQTPAPQDTAATDDVQITQPIKDLATQLNNNPVAIYNWVRNNVAFIPSYGSIQGSDLTLQNKRGNAFDTASLLIALFRAAGIPTRYVYGTIEVPANQVMNWVGGVTTPAAAQSLLGQGGIPNVALVSGGTVQAFRMEHVWVQAYVDYTPSRGALNKNPNTWVQLDPSFKHYQFTQGMNLAANVPVNGQDLLTQIQQGATIDSTQGYVQNLNTANLQTALSNYQTQVQNYINNQKANATVGDVLGTQTVVAENRPILLGSLPYKTVTIGNTFQALPDNLKWKFKTNIYPDDGISDGSSPIIEINQSTVSLAGRKITLSFVPATQADQDLINSYLPKPHADGTPIQPSELPSSLPGYLLNMKAEFRIDGQVVAQTNTSFTMGSNVKQANQYFNPANQSWDGGEDNDITVGEYDAIGMDLQGIGVQQVQNLKNKIAETQGKLQQFQQNPSDTSPISGLTKEDITGDIVQAGILGYFSQIDITDRLTAFARGDVVSNRLPSYGRFFVAAQPYYWFGIPRNVTFPSVVMDVDYILTGTEGKAVGSGVRVAFARQTGAASSAAENAVAESMLRNPALSESDPNQPQGVSTIKAISIASAQGKKIYTLNQGNQDLHAVILQNLQINQDVKAEIAAALASGKEVSVHEKNINVNGWVGSGYTILDPATGAGAYKIAGGTNGGSTQLPSVLPGLMLGLLGGIAAIVMSSVVLAVIAGVVAFIAAQLLNATYDKMEKLDFATGRFIGTMAGLILAIILGEFVVFTLSPLFVVGIAILMITIVSLLVSVLVDVISLETRYLSRQRTA